jgi:hypothetical protein
MASFNKLINQTRSVTVLSTRGRTRGKESPIRPALRSVPGVVTKSIKRGVWIIHRHHLTLGHPSATRVLSPPRS